MAIGSSLVKEGVVDSAYDVVEAITLVIGPDGVRLNSPEITDLNGNDIYRVVLRTQEQIELYNKGGITEEFLRTFTADDVRRGYSTINPTGKGNLSAPQLFGGLHLLSYIMNHYNQEARYEILADPSEFIRDVIAGRPVIALVDQSELRNSDVINQALVNSGEPIRGQASANHAIWITDYDIETNEFIINDSSGNGGERIPAIQLWAALEDSEMTYIAVGKQDLTPEETALKQSSQTLNKSWRGFMLGQSELHQRYTPEQAESQGIKNYIPESAIDQAIIDLRLLTPAQLEEGKVNSITGEVTGPFTIADKISDLLPNLPITKLYYTPTLVEHIPATGALAGIPTYLQNVQTSRRQALKDLGLTDAHIDQILKDVANVDVE